MSFDGVAGVGLYPGRPWRVFVDADVLSSRTLRDWILLLSRPVEPGSPYVVCGSEDVLAETVARMRDRHPEMHSRSLEVIGERLRHFWAATRISAFPSAAATFVGSDRGDLHVHSAAVAAAAEYVVTNDRHGIRPPPDRQDLLDRLPYEIYTADEFLMMVARQEPLLVADVASLQLRHHLASGGSADLPGRLRRAGAPRFADVVEAMPEGRLG